MCGSFEKGARITSRRLPPQLHVYVAVAAHRDGRMARRLLATGAPSTGTGQGTAGCLPLRHKAGVTEESNTCRSQLRRPGAGVQEPKADHLG